MTISESKGRFFLQKESILIDSHNESNQFDSNRELECSNASAILAMRTATVNWTCTSSLASGILNRQSRAERQNRTKYQN